MKIGFTGTRDGMTSAQYIRVRRKVEGMKSRYGDIDEARHGDCVGADEEFHAIVRDYDGLIKIVGHPPDDDRLRAWCECDELREPKPYLVRNADIVAESDHIIAAPKEMTEQQRGGTWSTVRKAKKAGKPVTIVYPDGSVAG